MSFGCSQCVRWRRNAKQRSTPLGAFVHQREPVEALHQASDRHLALHPREVGPEAVMGPAAEGEVRGRPGLARVALDVEPFRVLELPEHLTFAEVDQATSSNS